MDLRLHLPASDITIFNRFNRGGDEGVEEGEDEKGGEDEGEDETEEEKEEGGNRMERKERRLEWRCHTLYYSTTLHYSLFFIPLQTTY